MVLLIAVLLGASAAHANDGFRLLKLDGQVVKWGAKKFGRGATVTYGLAQERRQFPGARNCRVIDPLDELLSRSRISMQGFRDAVRHAAAMWEAAAALRLIPAGDGEPDILLGAQVVPRGIAFADVSHDGKTDAVDNPAIATIERSLICLNPERAWILGTGDGPPPGFALRLVLAHELGHAIGLDHPGPSGSLMSFKYDARLAALQPGDLAGVILLYGGRPDPIPTTVSTAATIVRP